MIDLDAIRARAKAAREYESCEDNADVRTYECPLCYGEQYVDGHVYDSKEPHASTIVAYGIGDGLKRAEEFVETMPRDALALCDELEASRARLADAEQRGFARGVASLSLSTIDKLFSAGELDDNVLSVKGARRWLGARWVPGFER